MKILFHENDPVYVHGLPGALRRLGHTVYVPRPEEGVPALRRVLDALHPDLILSAGWTPRHTRDLLRVIQGYCASTRSLHVYWSTEDTAHTNVWTFDFLQQAHPDAVVTISPGTVDLLRESGYPAEVLPFGFDPELHRPLPPNATYGADIALVASFYVTMASLRRTSLEVLVSPLLTAPWKLVIWGGNWQFAEEVLGTKVPAGVWSGGISFTETPDIYNSAKLVLALQNEVDALTSRTFDALGVGAAVLTVETPAVSRLFRDGEHLLCSRSTQETLCLVDRYLQDGQARRRIGEAGRQEVALRHSYDHRAAQLLEWVTAWLAEKRATGCLRPATDRRREILAARVESQAQDEGLLRLTVDLPTPRAGERLERATLECYADTVAAGGEAVCRLPGVADVLGCVRLDARGRTPYPHNASWCRWEVTGAVPLALGGALALEVHSEDGLSTVWGTPDWQPGEGVCDRMLAVRRPRFLPRLILVWGRDAP